MYVYVYVYVQARFMERKQLESPELRAQHILDLQRSLSESKATVGHLQAQLAQRNESAAVQAYHELRNAVYQEQTAQAQRVENLLMTAIMNIPKR